MPAIGTLVSFSAGQKIVSADVNSNFSAVRTAFNTSAVLTDTATTIVVTHVFTVNEIFQSGILVSGASTFSSGVTFTTGTTITASGVTVAGNVVFSSTVTAVGAALNVVGALVVTGNVTCGAAINVVGALVVTGNVTCGAALNVVGALVVTGTATSATWVSSGTGSAANVAFQAGLTGGGMWSSGANILNFSAGTQEFLRLDDTANTEMRVVRSHLRLKSGLNFVVNATLTTSVTVGFVYLPTMAGTSTATPATETGTIPMYFDTTNNQLQVYYAGGWHKAVFT